jgi:transcriptional regulator GlxA family with amidase domain
MGAPASGSCHSYPAATCRRRLIQLQRVQHSGSQQIASVRWDKAIKSCMWELPTPIAAFCCSTEHAVDLHDAGLELGHSRTLLYHCFHEHVDMSVAAYMKQERLNAAKKLLVETSRPINVIALECGYSCSLILSRTLKRNTGMTPRTYRKKHRAE